MSSHRVSEGVRLAVLGLAVFATRIPFLLPGYGIDADAWRVAEAARFIHQTGSYAASRHPPHPIQEFACSWLWPGGAFAINSATALCSVLAVLCVVVLFRRLGLPYPTLSGLALAATPSLYVNSTNAIDYVWALGFFLLAVLLAWHGRSALAGVSLGLAIGCRITSGPFALPLLVLLLWRKGRQSRVRSALHFLGSATLTGGAAFVPVVLEYGGGFLIHYQKIYPRILLTLKQVGLDLWGVTGSLGLAASLGILVCLAATGRAVPPTPGSIRRPWTIVSAIVILLTFALYFPLPHDAGYLLPAVPFVILLLALWLPARAYLGLCLSLLISPFFLKITEEFKPYAPLPTAHAIPFTVAGWRLRLEPFQGPILFDHRRRQTEEEYVLSFLGDTTSTPESRIVIVHEWMPMIRMWMGGGRVGQSRYVTSMPLDTLRAYVAQGIPVYYLPEADWPNELVNGYRLGDHGARMLQVSP